MKGWEALPVGTLAHMSTMMCNCNVGAISIGVFTLSYFSRWEEAQC